MSWTQADLDALEAASAKGVLRVRDHTGTEVEYRSLEDMRRTRDMIRAELGLINNSGIRRKYFSYGKGV